MCASWRALVPFRRFWSVEKGTLWSSEAFRMDETVPACRSWIACVIVASFWICLERDSILLAFVSCGAMTMVNAGLILGMCKDGSSRYDGVVKQGVFRSVQFRYCAKVPANRNLQDILLS